MLFMTIYTWESERRMEKGPLLPDGAKVIGEWSAIAGGKIFRLAEIHDAAAALAASRAWSDLGKAEMVPVVVTRGRAEGRFAEGDACGFVNASLKQEVRRDTNPESHVPFRV